MRGSASSPPAERGFALVLALLTIVVLGVMVLGGHQIAAGQFRVAEARRSANAAFYSAEAGLHTALGAWPPERVASLTPGATRRLMGGGLTPGDSFSVWITRLDDGRGGWRRLYLLRSVGLAHGSRGGRRQIGLLVRAPDLGAFCCFGAVTPPGDVFAAPSARVTYPPEGPEGGRLDCEGLGVPALHGGDGADDPGLDRARALYEHLSTRVDLRLDGPDTTIFRFAPTGAAPVIHALGDLDLRAGSGHGVLLVDGDLTLGDGFEFRGIVLIHGDLTLEGEDSRIAGTVARLGRPTGGVRLGPGTELAYSPCEALHSLRASGLESPRPLARHGWLEIFK